MFAAASFIKETTTSTGSGPITLEGAAQGFQSFASAFSDDVFFPYVITAADGTFEAGTGYLSAGGTVLNRAVVSETNSPNWWITAGVKEVYCAPSGGSSYPSVPHRFNSTLSSPSPSADATQGFHAGSMWVQRNGTTKNLYCCIYGGTPSEAASGNVGEWVWLGHPYSGPAPTTWGDSFYLFSAEPEVTSPADGAMVLGGSLTSKARLEYPGSIVTPFSNGDAFAGGHQKMTFGMAGTTTNATPTVLLIDGTTFSIPNDTLLGLEINVIAFDVVSGDAAFFTMKFGVMRVGFGNPVIVGSATAQSIGATAGAAAWAAAISVDTTLDDLKLTVTGASGKTIRWTASVNAIKASFS